MKQYYSRFRRGDVWYLHFDRETGDDIKNSSVERKSRPYLIVSCEENNLNAPTFNVIPITTRESDHLPMHIYFRYTEADGSGRNQLVLCEQITTVSVLTFNHPKSYFMYSFNLEFMNKVDDALARQLGLKPRIADMRVLERIVRELAENERRKIDAWKEKEAGMRAEQLAEFLSQTFNLDTSTADLINGTEYRDEELADADPKLVQDMRATAKARRTPPDTATVAIDTQVPAEDTSARVDTSDTVDTVIQVQPRRKRQRWTAESKRMFLEDYKTLTISEMSAKYNMKKSSIASSVCVFKKEVGLLDSE